MTYTIIKTAFGFRIEVSFVCGTAIYQVQTKEELLDLLSKEIE